MITGLIIIFLMNSLTLIHVLGCYPHVFCLRFINVRHIANSCFNFHLESQNSCLSAF